MTFKKENMIKFKEFLDSHGMFEYFCKAFLDSDLNRSHGFGISTTTYNIINTFDWAVANYKLKPTVSFYDLDLLWCKVDPKDHATQGSREVFIQELKSLDKTRMLLRAARSLS